MKVIEVLRGWKTIVAGRAPFLSIELTKECPLNCPGCYAYGDGHLGGNVLLTQVSDYKGQELIDRFMHLIDRYEPLHVSIVGGEPLVRFKELGEILPKLEARGVVIQLVTSAVRPIPIEWSRYKQLTIVVSIDGLAPEHDARRKPATYDRILEHIAEHRITIHCTITRQMTERTGYLSEFMDFWSARPEVEKVWFSLFTPQVGEKSYEILPAAARSQVTRELHELRKKYPKLAMTKMTIDGFLNPPTKPADCIFANTTRTITADLKTSIGPCQFGGNPDCSQCGCMASAGLNSIGKLKAGGIPIRAIYQQSHRIGSVVAAMRGD
jgi:sulfatase maturation enzyme AslB (radical SAM superfamily)